MAVILTVLLIALILGGLGFAAHLLWWIAVIVFVAWLVGFGFGGGATAGTRRRWYGRW
ncbi:hydrophobic protein [Catenulispora subtropica]|uniref:Hydrophobic protein n=1 Tax=Catenulispora subtropica TaxID=450798 RepID=A0ABP5DVU0_9ACTN